MKKSRTEAINLKNNRSLAYEIIKDLKKENKIIKILLGLSIISNFLIILL